MMLNHCKQCTDEDRREQKTLATVAAKASNLAYVAMFAVVQELNQGESK